MRISDWSSDVCSSDLAVDLVVADVGQLPGPEARHQVVAGTAQEVALPASHHPVLEAGEPGLLVELLEIERLAHRPSGKIGRASCRERVCQYVSISVVAVSFTQKQTHTPTKTQQ